MHYTTIMEANEVEKNILKCSRCGLCQEVCPIYDELKSESSATRGKLSQIFGLIKGDLKLNREILNNLDLCLNCEKCKLNCPSGVNTTGVFNKERKLGLVGKIMTSDFVFNLKIKSLELFSLFKKSPRFDDSSNILYFQGCIAKKLKQGLNLQGLKLKNGNFECCAIPYLTKGREDIYNKIAKYNEKIIEKADLVIFDCATCFSTVKDYPFKNPKNEDKLVFYTDFYKKAQFVSKQKASVTFHMPCHLKAAGVSLDEIEDILKSIKNINYTRALNAQDCCGFSGDFFLRHPKIAFNIAIKKIKGIIETKSDIVLTSCPTCLWSLRFSLFASKYIYKNKNKIKTMDMAEFLNKYCYIENKTAQKERKRTNQDAGMCV